MKVFTLFFSIFGIFFTGGKITDQDWQETTKIVYTHSDATVAPDYYRSYTLTVSKDSIGIVVRDYSRTLLSESHPYTEQEFQSFVGKLKKAGIKKVKEVRSFATGCDTEKLALYKGDDEYFSAYKTCDGGDMKLADRGSLGLIISRQASELVGKVDKTRRHLDL